MNVGRPIEYTPEKVEEIKQALEKYIEANDIPIVAEFAYQYGIRRQKLYEIENLADTMGRLIDKKEAQLEKLGLFNVINTSMASLSLKQLGWRERQDVNMSGGIQIVYADKDDEKL